MILGCYLLEPLVDFSDPNDINLGGGPVNRPRHRGSPITTTTTAISAATVVAGYEKGNDDSDAPHIPLAALSDLPVPKIPNEAKLAPTIPR